MNLSGLKFDSSSNYTILSEIGRGGMGIVFLAEKDNEGVADTVALKTIRTRSPEHEKRLKEEANIATGLRHENIVKTYGLESVPYKDLPPELLREFDALSFEKARRSRLRRLAPGVRFSTHSRPVYLTSRASGNEKKLYLIVMDYIEGTDIRLFQYEHFKRGLLLPASLGAFIVSRVARALAYAHQFIIHRDISPENILLNTQGVVKLSDFGIAVTEGTEGASGKIPYLSPEQVAGQAVDERTDVYSLGLVLYGLLTGITLQRVPRSLKEGERIAFVKMLWARPFPPADRVRPDVPAELSASCMKMLAIDRRQRYARVDDAARDLEQRYLYARGFGPTNNSLQAYMEIFDAGFKETTPEQLQQLPFLGKTLQRSLSRSQYTPEGRALLEEMLNR